MFDSIPSKKQAERQNTSPVLKPTPKHEFKEGKYAQNKADKEPFLITAITICRNSELGDYLWGEYINAPLKGKSVGVYSQNCEVVEIVESDDCE